MRPTDFPKSVRVWLWGPVAIFITFAPLAVSQVLQILSLVVLPFSRPLFRRINTRIAAVVWGYWAWMIQNVGGTAVEVVGDPIPRRENAIVYSNHQEMSDIVVILCLALPAGRAGDLKWLVKDIIKYVPGVGWGMLFLDCVFLKRDWAKDAATIKKVFRRIADNALPVWLVSFPEGTRATPAKLAKARQRPGGPAFQHVLRPKVKGFAASVLGLEHHVTAVYSVTIAYHGGVPSLVGLIRGDTRKITVHVRRTPLAELPRGEEALAAWLNEDFQRKDAWLAPFKEAPSKDAKSLSHSAT